MNKPYHLVVFDWEGTLGDTLGNVLNILTLEARRMHLGQFDEHLARHYLTYGLAVAIKKIFPKLTAHQQDELTHSVRLAMASPGADVYLIPGAQAVVEKMKIAGIHLAIATNKGHNSLRRNLQAAHMDSFFPVTRAADQVPAKPCPQMLEEIMDEYGVSAVETLMVGDSVSDIEMAAAIGVDAIGVNFYNQKEQARELLAAGALYVFDDYQQLLDYMQL
ncbi:MULTISPECIES: HAD family hydrolase [Legionella]|uniref:HAD family hydrolase n=1 Tax=Legionella septentrionalis TaxID=2498109 RepID=A0A3S0WZC9_9GAMM|nr:MULTISPECIES: HAD-IA family hydrolase [Legionella]MCP0914149.1 HAD-IA family hydrolase [Legionella sp. 27cVA30]RUQ81800.1 HAD family hydrolase [Legionella septentrionalis]RUQ96559.1 HAD family hydrolase [Legionella septentrionalis]RUR11697.1 HAD family hydrolase [Legionella septentrionalis]RUR17384.1 HAD family hydrolase [Legionella septentrionalis]